MRVGICFALKNTDESINQSYRQKLLEL